MAPQIDGPSLPILFDFSVGLRKDDVALPREVEQALEPHALEIRSILRDYGVLLVD